MKIPEFEGANRTAATASNLSRHSCDCYQFSTNESKLLMMVMIIQFDSGSGALSFIEAPDFDRKGSGF